MPYTSYDFDSLDASHKMKIDRTVYFDTTGEEIAPLTALPLTELQQMRQESTDAEQAIFEGLQQQAKAWEEQAGRSALLRKAIEYVMTPPVKHTSNKWEKTDYDWHTRSNAVYEMTYHIYENTRYDREQQKSVPYSWSLTWSVRTNGPDNGRNVRIAGYGVHHRSEDGKYLNMGNGTRAFAVPAQEAQPEQDTFTIYQLKREDATRDYRFEPYDRLQAAGLAVDPAHYEPVYSGPMTPDMTLDAIYTRFNLDHPQDFKGHSLSVSDVVVMQQGGQSTAHYVDSFGYKTVPEFLQPENYLKATEQSTEQNYNMIDGMVNNAPTVGELEAKAKAGEVISLTELATAIQAEKGHSQEREEKPSIRAQLKQYKEQTAQQKKTAKTKSYELEV